MKGIIYTRVSSDEQIKGMSLDFQREDCLRYAEENGITVLRIFEERGESAKFADRPELLALLDYCRKNKRTVDTLIVWKIDRLSRNQMDYYFLKRTLLGHGIALCSATEPALSDSSSIAGRVFETFSALQAEIDNTIRRDRAVRGMAAKLESGIYPWQPPLGYLCARSRAQGMKKTEPDAPDPTRFALIEHLFRTCLEKKVAGSVELAKVAQAIGLTTRTGKRVYPQLIDRIMANKFYAGLVVNPWTNEEVSGRHRAVITPDEFYLIQRIRNGKRIGPILLRPEHPDFPLRRTVRCEACSAPLTGSWSRGNGGRYAYYHCPNKNCELYGKSTPKRELEAMFSKRLDEIVGRPNATRLITEVIYEVWGKDAQVLAEAKRKASARKRELEERLNNLIGMKERELLTNAEFLARKAVLHGELAEVTTKTEETKMVHRDIPTLTAFGGEFLDNLPVRWTVMVPDEKRRFQKHLFPQGIPYRRDQGLGTAKMGLIYELLGTGDMPKSRLVRRVRESWNQILEDLREIQTFACQNDTDGEVAVSEYKNARSCI